MLSDIEISRQSPRLPVHALAERLAIPPHLLHPHGHYKGKLDLDLLKQAPMHAGKLVLVSAITPTPLGEGKTVTTIGLAMGLNHIGHPGIATIRQPSLGPVFGVKGGAAGGGMAQVVPMEEMNLHLTGDFHALSAAHNLAAAALDARLFHEQKLGDQFTARTGLTRLDIDPANILWPRTLDMNDRALRHLTIGQGDPADGVERPDRFVITAASELMAILALASDLKDLRARIGRIQLALDLHGNPVTAEQLEVAGAMTVLLKDALQPTLMQTTEQTPVLVHAGPFANIAHGNSSVIADRMALGLADYVVTEAGFGSDMGLEKFFNIKGRQSGLAPACVVLVATVRGLKANSGLLDIRPGQPLPESLLGEDLATLRQGCANLAWHIANARRYGVPVVVAINRFPTDSEAELALLAQEARQAGAQGVALSQAFTQGGAGAAELARTVVSACAQPSKPRLLYPDEMSLAAKLATLVECGYGGRGVTLSDKARQQLARLSAAGWDHLPICMAKTPLSISHDPARKGVPTDFEVPVEEVKLCAGAGFVYALAGPIMTMPGLGSLPAYRHIDIDDNGEIIGLS
ncbi:formate--tetrahydrofolate ligase [Aeromonas taiwanensis]|uniref:Formate--tetrahydrofolate ligase n=1 Tax=Aeromonas taiwanensis TaxID=633417 RepID=A0A5F0KA49_9GAMM|nr:formate--tetrahydrofolate ligase [Aeromonas taiwanensis]TFF75042.1 formate--tetrahydrofolate ligase [Aeromonas taiwanensis]TFF76209.1 formate--tetrahydrofolate ligase [Aeromonas taiwanensis]TFF79306.1 formate--tetrahydrofolate ligase [Aeromonas taiwanensis]